MVRVLSWILIWICIPFLFSQEIPDPEVPPLETCYDVTSYNLEVKVDARFRRIAGTNIVYFRVTKETSKIQLDLDARFKIAKVLFEDSGIPFYREGNALILEFPRLLKQGESTSVSVVYGGAPQEAVNPPWKGGFVWERDENRKSWVGVVCQREGASLWWPVKDKVFDKPDSMRLSVIVPENILAISNGKLQSRKKLAGNFIRWTWQVRNSIDPANVSLFIGDYKQFRKPYEQGASRFYMDFYVRKENEEIAKAHFIQLDEILKCYENHFGPYPFARDGYSVVESSNGATALQGITAYDGSFANDAWGVDKSLARETAKQWFGVSLRPANPEDEWINASLVLYAESLLQERKSGADSAAYFLSEIKSKIRNERPIIGKEKGEADNDFQNKGVWILHGLRFKLNDDKRWFRTLKEFVQVNHGKPVSTNSFIEFVSKRTQQDMEPFFEQYLYHNELPVLQFKWRKKGKKSYLSFRWKAGVPGFEMPLVVQIKDSRKRFFPQNEWQVYEGEKFTMEDVSFEEVGFLYETSLEFE